MACSLQEMAPILSCRSRSDPISFKLPLPATTTSPSLDIGSELWTTTVDVLSSSCSVDMDVGMIPWLFVVLVLLPEESLSANVSTTLAPATAAVDVSLLLLQLLLLLLLLLSLPTDTGGSKDILEWRMHGKNVV